MASNVAGRNLPPRAVASVDEVGAGDIEATLDEATGEVACSARWFPDVVGKGEVRIVEQGIDGRWVSSIEVVGDATGIGVVGGSDGLEDGGLGAGPVGHSRNRGYWLSGLPVLKSEK